MACGGCGSGCMVGVCGRGTRGKGTCVPCMFPNDIMTCGQ